MAAISVKVPRVKLIEALQASLDKENAIPDDVDTALRKADEAYNTKRFAWGKRVAKELLKTQRVTGISTGGWRKEFSITFSLGDLEIEAEPVREIKTVVRKDVIKIRELENAIKLLSISEEEFVNASTYRTVVQYL